MKLLKNPRSLLILVILLGLYLFIKPQPHLILDTWDILSGRGTIITSKVDAITRDVRDALVTDSSFSPKISDGRLSWISDDDYIISVEQAREVVSEALLSADSSSKVTKSKESIKFHDIVSQVMYKNSFKLNSKNSSKSEGDSQSFYLQAYDNSDIRCVASTADGGYDLSNHVIAEFSFSCVDNKQFQEAYNKDVPFLKALIANGEGRGTSIRYLKIKGNFAKLGTGPTFGPGHEVLMYKSGSEWKLVTTDVGNIFCDRIKNIPQELYPPCYIGNGQANKFMQGNPGWSF